MDSFNNTEIDSESYENMIKKIFSLKNYEYKKYLYYKRGNNKKYIELYKRFKNNLND